MKRGILSVDQKSKKHKTKKACCVASNTPFVSFAFSFFAFFFTSGDLTV